MKPGWKILKTTPPLTVLIRGEGPNPGTSKCIPDIEYPVNSLGPTSAAERAGIMARVGQ